CDQYLIQQGVDLINKEGRCYCYETRKAVHKCLRDDIRDAIARTLLEIRL
ncbi:4701_t:CDS:2, partial [Racocetra fulgida]